MRWRGIVDDDESAEPVPDSAAEEWVRAYQVAGYQDAMRVRLALEPAGIEFLIQGENYARIEGSLSGLWTGALASWLLVRRSDLEQARELLREAAQPLTE